jgi:hypothetical protein
VKGCVQRPVWHVALREVSPQHGIQSYTRLYQKLLHTIRILCMDTVTTGRRPAAERQAATSYHIMQNAMHSG